jgi:predicted aldo/keto reductase-like oxidoreductase
MEWRAKMNRKLFEKLGVESSVLGFGAMRLPVKDGAIHRESALEMVDHAYRNGITYFDTAWPYHGGTSEGFLGEALGRYPRESFLLADKMPVWAVNNEADMDRVFHEQLSRCRVPYFDFYLLHALGESRFDHCVEIGALAFLEKMRAQGKLRFIGFSFHDKNENFERIVDYYPWDFVQIQYNYIDVHTMDADFLYKALEQRGIPIVVMEPVRGGALAQLPEKPAGILRSYAPQRSLASWAVRWVASQPGVKVLLSGMSDMGQLKDNIATLSEPDYPLSAVEQDMLARATQALLSYNTVPCTGCGYCMECPFGVDIPRVFRIYNNLNMFSNEILSPQEYFINLEGTPG